MSSPLTARVRSLVDLVRARVEEAGARPAYTWIEGGQETGELTYAELDRRARALAVTLAARAGRGERALLLFPPGLDFITAFLGCLYAGVVAVPAYPPRRNRGLERLSAIVADTRPRLVLTTEKLAPRIAGWVEQAGIEAAVVAADGVGLEAAERWRDPGIAADTLAFLQYTSGSTSTPKGVMVRHGNLLHNEEMIRRAFGQTAESVIVSWLPLYHDMGLIGGVLQPLYLGARCILTSPLSFLQNPRSWLSAIDRYRGTTSGGPDFGYALCVRKVPDEERQRLDLSSWTVAFNGSEPVRAETLDAFARAFEPAGFSKRAFYPCYGLAEATLFVTGGEIASEPPVLEVRASALGRHRVESGVEGDSRRLIGCGRVWLDQDVAIVDPETGTPCGPGVVGEIWVAGPSVAGGYWGKPEETGRDFGAVPAGGDRKYLRTGDLGFLDGGELYVTGRLKDLIILRGRNYYPHDFERTAEAAHPALRPGCSAAFTIEDGGEERLVVVQEVDPRFAAGNDVAPLAHAVFQAVAEEHEVAVHEVLLAAAGQVPKTSSGKVRRSTCRERYAHDRLIVLARTRRASAPPAPAAAVPVATTAPGTPAEQTPEGFGLSAADLGFLDEDERLPVVKLHLRQAAARALRLPPGQVDAETPLTALGLDSLAAMELVHQVEAALGVDLPLAELLDGPTLTELARTVLERFQAAPPPTPRAAPAASGVPESYPLSYGQRALWFLHRLAPDSAAYHIAAAFEIKAPLEPTALERAVQALALRHPVLRTTFHAPADLAGEPFQRVSRQAPPALSVIDAAGWDENELAARLEREAARPFDLETGPLFRVTLLRGEAAATVLVCLHHAIGDFWSMGVLARELGALLGGAHLPPPAATYADFVAAERARLEGPDGERLESFWRERLDGCPELQLPTDRPRPRVQSYRGAQEELILPAELEAAARRLAREARATLNATLLAAFEALLHRWSGQADLTVGSPVVGRDEPRWAGVVGYFVNPVVLRSRLAGADPFAEHLERTRRGMVAALEHAGMPFPLLAERLNPERDAGRSPLFQVMFVHHRGAMAGEDALAALAVRRGGVAFELGGLPCESVALPETTSQFDLTLSAAETGERIALSLLYNRDLFDPATARRLLGGFERLLEAAAAEPARAVAALPLLTPTERRQLLAETSGAGVAAPPERLPVERVVDVARVQPDTVAVAGPEGCLTYAGLLARAEGVAARLADLGVGPEDVVAVHLTRGTALVVSLVGVMASGAAYLPLDPALPAERLEYLAADAGITAVVTDRSGRAAIEPLLPVGARVIEIETVVPAPPVPGRRLEPESTAYLLYTSGSTGRPKGVAVSRRALGVHVESLFDGYAFTADDRVLQLTAPSFDPSLEQILCTLSVGSCLVPVPPGVPDPLSVVRQIEAEQVTVANLPPAFFQQVLATVARPPLPLRLVEVGGEELPAAVAERHLRGPWAAVALWNGYGPTETVVTATVHPVTADDIGRERVPIGRPLAGRRVYCLDRLLEPVPVGVAGELYLGGGMIARGYHRRPAGTAAAFVPDPFAGPGSRLYRTGDRVRLLPDGSLQFLGRVDRQVKIRGFRVEPGEVEGVLAARPDVVEVAVLPTDGRLVACLVPRGAERPAADEIRACLADRLPAYMVPSAFVVLDRLPRTPGGKVDLPALAAMGEVRGALAGSPAAGRTAPRTPAEETVAAIWRQVLRLPEVGVEEDFFALGGHSLLATQVASRLRESVGVELPLSALFETTTVADLARRVEAAVDSDPEKVLLEGAPPLEPAGGDGPWPLSFAQERLWFLAQLEPDSTVYHVAEALDLDGPVGPRALFGALSELVRRHGALRTVLPPIGDSPAQVVEPPRPVPPPVADLAGLAAGDRERQAERLTRAAAEAPFDLARGPLFRPVLLRLDESRHTLLAVMHHVVTDGWSLGLLAAELSELYRAVLQGAPSPLPEPPLSYGDYAVWQRRWLAGPVLERLLAWWRGELAGAPPVLELPTDRPRGASVSDEGERVPVTIPRETAGRLTASLGTDGTPFMVLLAGFAVLLARLSRQDDVVVGSPIAHRNRRELEGIVGFFANTLALRVELPGRSSFRETVERVRRRALGAYAHQDLPFETLVEALAPRRDLTTSPLFQAFFVLQNAPLEPLSLEGLTLARRPVDTGTAHFDLSLDLTEVDGGFEGFFELRRDLFDRATVERWAGHLATLLAAAAEQPGLPWRELPLLTVPERRQLVEGFNATARPEPGGRMDERLAPVFAGSPDAVAVEHDGRHLSYGALDRLSSALAAELARRGVGPERPVGICLPRSVEQVAAVLAVLRAGGSCQPLDPAYPDERLAFMAADAGPALLLTSSELAGRLTRLTEGAGAPVLPVELAALGAEPAPAIEPLSSSLAYFIYTSGSTGRPKGVAMPHRALTNLLAWQDRHLGGARPARTLQFAPMSFDVFFQELFGTWGTGGTLVLVDEEIRRDPQALWRLLAERRVERLFVPFVALSQLAEAAREEAVRPDGSRPEDSALAEVATAGEQLQSSAAVRELFRRAGARLANQYGPSEAHVVTALELPTDSASWPALPGIGRPIDNTRIYVVEREMEPAPLGVAGEVLVGGSCLARGYAGRPGRTAAAFVPDPFASEPGGRLYRTGDLARWLPGGELELLGRIDQQVKIRGHRVEPGEVESVLSGIPEVREAVVAVRGQGAGERRLVAWVVPADPGADARALAERLGRRLAERLPAYMVPSAVAVLDAFPFTPSGKLDRAALPEPEPAERPEAESPATPAEELVAGVFAELLEVPRPGRGDGFFDLGGHSLLAARAASRLRRLFGVELSVKTLFERPAVAELARHLESLAAGGAQVPPPLVPADRAGDLPASYAQERLWFLDRLEPGSPLYNMSGAFALSGPLGVAALGEALTEVASRQESLRTRFVELDGAPGLAIDPPAPVPLPVADLSRLAPADRERQLHRSAEHEAARPFDLAAGPLFRVRLARLGGDGHTLFVSMHHVISDGWSLGVLIRELGELHGAALSGAPAALPPLPVQYADYALWQRRWLSGPVLGRHLDHWHERLAGLEPTVLPADRVLRAGSGRPAGERPVALPAELVRGLHELAGRSGATLFMVLLAGFELLLARYAGRRDVAVGTPVAGRSAAETEGLVGFFVNTLVLRGDLSGRPSFNELLARVRGDVLDAFAHQEAPFAKVVERLRPEPGGQDEDPLVRVVLALQNAPAPPPALAGVEVIRLPVSAPAAKFDLTLELEEPAGEDGELAGQATYRRDLFDAATVDRFLGHFRALLETAVVSPELPVADLPMLSPAELRQLLLDWSGRSKAADASVATAPGLFLATASRQAAASALVWDGGQMTYGELRAAASRLARVLLERGVGPETAVGITIERSPGFVVAALAVTLAGGAYVPLDLAYPAARLAAMAEDAGVGVVLADRPLPEELSSARLDVLRLDDLAPVLARQSPEPPAAAITPESLAYVMFTSGSTGRPKGVAVCHRAIGRLIRRPDYAHLGQEETLMLLAPVSFDASTLEMWGVLANGGRLAVPPAGPLGLPELGDQLHRHRVTTLWLTAGLFHRMVDENLPGLAGVRQLLAGGDVLSPEHVRRVLAGLPATSVINGYGPTENTTFTCCHRMERPEDLPAGATVPLGTPISGTRAYVLDDELAPVPVGVWGELYAGGSGLARGYVGRPKETAAAFVPAPPALTDAGAEPAGARLYATGDLARWSAAGVVEFAGRRDQQVKVRGFRIELGEVESALVALPGVRDAVVTVAQDGPGDGRLVAYVVAEENAQADPAALGEALSVTLPPYMLPSFYVPLSELPLNANGKVDRKALPAPTFDREAARRAPATAIEAALAELFAAVLGVPEVGADESFFALGGHSLLATRLVSRIRERFGVELPLRQVFEQPTVAALAGWVDGRSREVDEPLVPVPREGDLPLSFAQERLYILDRLEPGNAAYNLPAALRLTGPLFARALDQALLEVVRRHEALRTTFDHRWGRPVQVIHERPEVAVARVDLSHLEPADRRRQSEILFAREAARPFDLAQGPLARFSRLRLGPAEHVLVLDLHHVVTDGWSMGILLSEVAPLYGAFRQGEPSPLADLALQYPDYAVWQRRQLAGDRLATQLAYWREALAGAPPGLELPTDRPRPAVRSYRGAWARLVLPAGIAAGLEELTERHGASLFMTLLAAFDLLACRWSGQDDVLVGSPVAGRNRGEIEGLIGFFLNTLVLRASLAGDPTFEGLLDRVREAALEAYAHQDLPFEKLLDELGVERDLSRTPLFSVFFNMVNMPFGDVALPGVTVEPVRSPELPSKFDLTLYARQSEGTVAVDLAYNADLFDAATVEALLGQYRFLLEQVADDPARPISSYSLVPPEARGLLPDPTAPLSASFPGPVHELFLEQARRFPLAEAVTDRDGSWTYRDLARLSGRLAGRFAGLGVGLEDPVAIWAHRGAALVPSVLGVLRAGGAFVMLDPAYPATRLVDMLEQARPRALVHLSAAGPLPAEVRAWLGETGCPVVEAASWPDLEARVADAPEAPRVAVGPDHLAYISFTSGSTGRPKGILGRHGPLSHFLPWQRRRFGLSRGDRYSLLSGLAHDPLQRDLFTPLCLGGTVVVPDPAEIFAAGRLAAWMRRERVNVAHLTPAMGQVLAETGPEGPVTVPSLRWVLLVGDALTRRDVARLETMAPNVTCVNLYGSTETQRAVAYHVVGRGGHGEPREVLPLGRGMEDVQLLVLSPSRPGERPRLAGVGELGELAIRSPHLARGYLNDPERSGERFRPSPWREDAADRLYLTGDLGRYRADGEAIFAGRADTQVKVRGFRIELGEIEGELGRLPGVRESAVLAPGEGAARRIAAFVVAEPGHRPVPSELREALADRLPAYMVPATVTFLDGLPLTPNGKTDRRALAALERAPMEDHLMQRDPETDTEKLIARLIREALEVEQVGVDDNFFDLGGNSLLLVQVHGRLQEALGREIPAVDLFSHPTVRELAAHLSPGERGTAAGGETAHADRSDKLKAGRARLASRRARRG